MKKTQGKKQTNKTRNVKNNNKKTNSNRTTKNNRNMKKKNSSKKSKSNKKVISIIGIISVVILLILALVYLINRKTNSDSNLSTGVTNDYSYINVLLTNNSSRTWDAVSIASDTGLTYTKADKTLEAGPNEYVTINDSNWLDASGNRTSSGEVTFTPKGNGKLYIKNSQGVKKGYGYSGTVTVYNRVVAGKATLYVCNMVLLEEYVKGVISSEMPTSFGKEALKAQAVCARTYAAEKLRSYTVEACQANVDDTTAFQVYQEEKASEPAIEAVNETKGQVMKYKGNIIDALFYSTSSGFTQTQKSDERPYLKRQYISLDNTDRLKELGVTDKTTVIQADENVEAAFKEYFMNKDDNALEGKEKYFRWDCQIDMKTNHDKVCQTIINQYEASRKATNANKSNNMEKVTFSEGLMKAVADQKTGELTTKGFGDFKYWEVKTRSVGGVITGLNLVFENGSVTINDELTIRQVLGKASKDILLNDGSKLASIETLYSAAFTGVANENGYHIYGGGYGHGCGMSQYGAKCMASAGKGYEEILNMFYKECNLEALY